MANRRMISKSISISSKANSISDFASLLFTWMIPHADDYGILDGDEGTIKALVVPRRKQTERQVGQALSEIQQIGLIWRYFYKNKPYVQFTNFEEHQEGLHKRTAPKYPLYMECRRDSENFREIPGNSCLTEPNRTEPNLREEKRTEPKVFGTAQNVTLSDDEYTKLLEAFPDGVVEKIERLSLYKGSTGKTYKSDYLTILNWARKSDNQVPTKPLSFIEKCKLASEGKL